MVTNKTNGSNEEETKTGFFCNDSKTYKEKRQKKISCERCKQRVRLDRGATSKKQDLEKYLLSKLCQSIPNGLVFDDD